MDVRAYYRKVREAEAAITEEQVVMVSHATPEGGKAGVLTEAPRAVAAKLIAEDRAHVATEEQAQEYREARLAAKARHDQEESARRMQVVVVPAKEFHRKDRS